ncbi:hypothetical protein [Parafrankia sp. FMc2]|uniref:hypothetical protein n=1 Tax=Parafrankia sp. FMc2 TaxID=3233196 RepID=UPI0034D64185
MGETRAGRPPGGAGPTAGPGSSAPPPGGGEPTARPRGAAVAFVVVLVVCLMVGTGYVVHVVRRDADRNAVPVAAPGEAPASLDPSSLRGDPRVVFRSTARDGSYGRVAMVPLGDPDGTPAITRMSCDRVDVRGETGLCLAADRGLVTTYAAYLFDADLRTVHSFRLSGVPSRARLSADARLAAVTVFVTGHSYAGPAFSTATTLYDVAEQRELGNLEQFAIFRDGERINPVDQNFWGVTFADDGDTFYATLATAGTTYLVRGSLRDREVHTLTTNVECPALSPDGTRVAFKERAEGDGPVRWVATVLDLATMRRTHLADTRSIDDQIAWYDNRTIAYGLPRAGGDAAITDTWVEPADGSGAARVLVPRAWSPAFRG